MDRLLKSISYIFHPLLMPLFAVAYYFSISPRYYPPEIIKAKFVALFILTIILPLLLYLILKLIGKVNTVNLSTTKERIYPLMLNSIVVLIILKKILTPSQSPELYFFFVGILISNISCLLLAIMRFKASIHMIAITGVFMFFIALSIHFSINLNNTLIFMAIISGAVATSRLHLKAHSYIELIIGLFLGVIPQLILVTYWL
ncbi:hypothetical protein [Algibacter pectinivorans]|uniref:PAP2 superfamily protein n=1 Tax=Algibacter pectinivorans TaxID=870482 RepID=A0A1I1N033_9FLAO|nr:hypothetical protein [Algibacter pectinivorans]SFC88848.1 hypothetical protein SAMN04487987_101533 [Algibacter pectinivorans]